MKNYLDLDAIYSSVCDRKCIVLIGPDLPMTAANGELENLAETFSNHLVDELQMCNDDRCKVYNPKNFPLVAQCFEKATKNRSLLNKKLKRFYKKVKINLQKYPRQDSIFESLAKLPISIFITFRYDHTLEHYLEAQGKEPIEKYYDLKGKQISTLGEENLGSVNKPLVYRLLGSTDKGDSLTVTEDDLLNLLHNISKGNPAFPTDLKNALKEKHLLFLGCNSYNYFLHVLLYILEVYQPDQSSYAPGSISTRNQENEYTTSIWFYKLKDFKMLEVEARECILELSKRWQEELEEENRVPVDPSSVKFEDAPKVFISYVSEDKLFAEQLIKALKDNGIDPWFDKQSLECGDKWESVLENAIGNEADFFIVLLSTNLANRIETWVNLEVGLALKRQSKRRSSVKFILPVQIDGKEILLDELSQFQTFHIGNFEEDVPMLASIIKKHFEKYLRTILRTKLGSYSPVGKQIPVAVMGFN